MSAKPHVRRRPGKIGVCLLRPLCTHLHAAVISITIKIARGDHIARWPGSNLWCYDHVEFGTPAKHACNATFNRVSIFRA